MSLEKTDRNILEVGIDAVKVQFEKFTSTFELKLESFEKILKNLTVNVKEPEDSFSYTSSKRATTTAISKQKIASLEWKNPLDADVKVYEISFIPDAGFKTNGLVEILIDGAIVYENEAIADFTDLLDMSIKFRTGKKLSRNKKVEARIWTDDGTSSSLLITVQFGVQ